MNLKKSLENLASAAYWITEGGEFAEWVKDKEMPWAAYKELKELAEQTKMAQEFLEKEAEA